MLDFETVWLLKEVDTHRFGGRHGELNHVFTFSDYARWVQTYYEESTLVPVCGAAAFRPQYMGVMVVGEKVCPQCAEHYVKVEK